MNTPQDIIALDTETGGVYPAIHPLLSVSIVASWNLQPFTVYIEPLALELIDPGAAKVNGYTHEKWMERGALPLMMAMELFNAQLARLKYERPGAVLVAHNAGFDRGFIDEAFRQCDLQPVHRHNWRCSMLMMAFLMDIGQLPTGSLSLNRLGEVSGQWPAGGRPAVHEAHEDALVCLKGYQFLQHVASL